MPATQSNFSEEVTLNPINGTAGPGRQARYYAIKELARRARVSADFFQSWKVTFEEKETIIRLQPGSNKSIRFRNAPEPLEGEPNPRAFQTVRAAWMYPPDAQVLALVPDFVIPFSDGRQTEAFPLFVQVSEDCVRCLVDLPVSTLLTLSRYEETLPGERDVHGRFPASASIAVRDQFLDRPVVDEYGLALEQALTCLLPGWRPVERRMRVKLSHDIDHVGVPFSIKTAVKHTLRRRPMDTVRDFFSWPFDVRPAGLESIYRIVQASLQHRLDSAVYWKASAQTPWDTGYDLCHPKVRKMITWLHDQGVETGAHPSYNTFQSPDLLMEEVQVLRSVLGEKPMGGRQHYLRWCPDTWLHWEKCGLAYDSTVGYADRIGFRAGTCFPYRPWLLHENREANLIEIPLVVMDKTLMEYMGLTAQESLEAVRKCVARCRVVGGVFTLLWHNSRLSKPKYSALYANVLDHLGPSEALDWKNGSSGFY